MPRRLYSATIPILGLIGLLEISRHAARAVPTNRSSDSLRVAPVMHVARAAHTLTSLPSGDALVVGGFTTNEGQSAAQNCFCTGSIDLSRPVRCRPRVLATRRCYSRTVVCSLLAVWDLNGRFLPAPRFTIRAHSALPQPARCRKRVRVMRRFDCAMDGCWS